MSSMSFPGESAAYREARNELLEAEIALRAKVEQVAALRRRLPLGGEPPRDYVFEEGAGDPADTSTVREVRFSELFGDKKTLVLYSFMYGPTMKAPCPLCTSILDGLDAQAAHIGQHVSLAVCAKSPIGRVREFARTRGWSRLRLLSCARSTYQHDYHGESEAGEQWPMMNVFTKRNGKAFHFWASELFGKTMGEGTDARHVDMVWPLWNVLDLTPEGRGKKWYPALKYPGA